MALKLYFEDAGVVLYHGDCREVLHDLPSETFDLILTDPPYLVSYSGRWGSDCGVIEGDSDASWVAPAFVECWRVLKPDTLCISFYGWPHADTFLTAWKMSGFRPVSALVLVKERVGLGYFTRSQHEPAYILAKGRPAKPEVAISDVLAWEAASTLFHPNQKPIGAITKLVAAYSNGDGILVDPFCGSGTTLIAARSLGKRAVGIEIDERFCEAAAIRLSQAIFDFNEPTARAKQSAFQLNP